jgi:pimeloyl-ACP methyl ester carboxylesterase
VEKLELAFSSINSPEPVVMIHGQAQTGTNFLNKPDSSLSWISQCLEAGHSVYIVDQTFRGRSPWAPRIGAAALSTYPAEYSSNALPLPSSIVSGLKPIPHAIA